MDVSFERSKATNQEGRKERDRMGLLSPPGPAWEGAGAALPRARVGPRRRSRGRARPRAPSAASARGQRAPCSVPQRCHGPRSSSWQ